MLYITEDQLKLISDAVKSLPVRVEDFDDADKWVGIYIHLKRIESQKIVEKQEEEDGRPSDQ